MADGKGRNAGQGARTRRGLVELHGLWKLPVNKAIALVEDGFRLFVDALLRWLQGSQAVHLLGRMVLAGEGIYLGFFGERGILPSLSVCGDARAGCLLMISGGLYSIQVEIPSHSL